MSFYSELMTVYEKVFPVNSATINFLKKNLNNDSVVLDVACGIGGHCKALSPNCMEIHGVDNESEMINKAKNTNTTHNTNYDVGDMLKLSELYSKKFDCIYCIGNSIVHLPSKEQVLEFLKESYRCLNSSGELIIQIINYDRIFSDNVKSLPVIKNDNVEFIRNYEFQPSDDKVDFVTHLKVNDKTYNNSIKLLALKSQELSDMLKKAGFESFSLYSNFKEEKYSGKGYATIVRAQKN